MWNSVWHGALAVLIGLITGGTMSVATSCVWNVLQVPSRVQHTFHAASPASCSWAISLGLLLASLRMCFGLSLPLPLPFVCVVFLFGGMFVGMIASALGEIIEVVPVMVHRFCLGDVSLTARICLTVGKGLGAIVACLVFTL